MCLRNGILYHFYVCACVRACACLRLYQSTIYINMYNKCQLDNTDRRASYEEGQFLLLVHVRQLRVPLQRHWSAALPY